MDARSYRGIFSRGRPVYRAGSNAPNPRKSVPKFDVQKAVSQRLANERRKHSKSLGLFRPKLGRG